jgi:hypothetical protein
MTDNLLDRLFSLDIRKDMYPALANPTLELLLVDPRNDLLYALIDHWIDGFGVATFPGKPIHHPMGDAVYIQDVALDPVSGILVIGGEDSSGNEPLKVYDTVSRRPLWFASNLSKGFMRRAPRVAQAKERTDGMQIHTTDAHSVPVVGIAPGGAYIVSCEFLRRGDANVRKYSIAGDLLGELAGVTAGALAIAPDGRRVLIASGKELSWVEAANWSAGAPHSVASATLTKVAIRHDGMQLAAISQEGEVVSLAPDLSQLWRLEIDAIPRCARYCPGSTNLIVGTNLGDLLVIDVQGKIVEHERVSESVRDIAFLHNGRHIAVGCKNMDIHMFVNRVHAANGEYDDWEQRLRIQATTVYTSTSSLTHARVFISYASPDREFADRLERSLSSHGLQCWRDEHSLTVGRITKQLHRAILKNDLLIVILSQASLNSDWVQWEVASARTAEKLKGRDVICPIAIDSYWKEWEDDPVLKREITKYHIFPFDEASDEATFTQRISQLVDGLRENYLTIEAGAG